MKIKILQERKTESIAVVKHMRFDQNNNSYKASINFVLFL